MRIQKATIFALALEQGTLAQLVEQRTENPCVPGSIPGGTTNSELIVSSEFLFITSLKNRFPVWSSAAMFLLEGLFW